ncbi:hypothetical protein BGX28_001181, partial [Mortierella sp. GBA30]
MSQLNLFCVVDGESTSSAFSVKATSTGTVYDLKELIKAKKAVDFHNVDANNLTVWRVSVPISDGELPLLLSTLPEDKRKLGPAMRLSKMFPEELPEETIHIIVQRPPA